MIEQINDKYILGISAFYHDSAAALLKNGEIMSAAQEERFTRIKHDSSFPINAIMFILKSSNIRLSDIDYFVFYDKPILKFQRLISTYLANIPFGFGSYKKAMPTWISQKLFLKSLILKKLKKIDKGLKKDRLLFTEHHFSHAASAFYPSPYKEAVILTLDGVGEWATSTVSVGKENKLEIVKEIHFPNSLGLLYSAFTYYTGFKVLSGEYKLMGLAPYGKPIYTDIIKDKLINIKPDGSFRMNQKYFNYMTGRTMINEKFEKLFGQPKRNLDENITEFHMNIASSIQKVTEEIVLSICNNLYEDFKIENLCLAGGVALNCVANGKLLKESKFKNIWIQPAAGDAGGALGAAYAAWYNNLNNPRHSDLNDKMSGSYLGPSFEKNIVKKKLSDLGAVFTEMTNNEIIGKTALDIANNKAVGWFQGRMEFGPRALGNRSIIADPRSENMQKNLNLKVKFRESFRPFAPAILYDDLKEWFNINDKSPYMLLVATILKKHMKNIDNNKEAFGIDRLNLIRSRIPAVTHVDYSSRIQTVHKETNQKLYSLIKEFKKITGVPIIVNTSFNVRGEPMVCSPEDAFRCFMGTDIEVLVIENFYLEKNKQDKKLLLNYKDKFELD